MTLVMLTFKINISPFVFFTNIFTKLFVVIRNPHIFIATNTYISPRLKCRFTNYAFMTILFSQILKQILVHFFMVVMYLNHMKPIILFFYCLIFHLLPINFF